MAVMTKEKPKIFKEKIKGKYGEVVTITTVYPYVPYMVPCSLAYRAVMYEINQDIRRIQKRKDNKRKYLKFSAEYSIDTHGKKGVLTFFANFNAWYDSCYFRIKFDKNNPNEKFAEIEMFHWFQRTYEEIDICTFGLLMTKFFESCNPHCDYHAYGEFIDCFQNSKYEKLRFNSRRFYLCS